MEETLGTKKLYAVVAGLVGGALALSACTPAPAPAPTDSGSAATDTSVSVMWNQPLFSLNNNSSFGNATANANIVYLTQDNFTYYDKGLNIVTNDGYGTYEKVSDDPLTVKMTLADTATWSDGVPVTNADAILAYGAISSLYNTVTGDDAQALYNEDGTIKPNDAGSVYFDSSSPGMALITDFPALEGDKGITVTYSKPFADWEQLIASFGAGLPAHIVAKRALGIEDPTEGKAAIIAAFQNKDNEALSKISNVWNSDWNFTQLPTDADLLVHSGPYSLTEYAKGQYLTLTKDEAYKGKLVPQVNAITVRYNEDPMAAVQALENGEVQLISPQATADILTAVQGLQGVSVYTGDEGTYEHVDLTFNNKGPFDPATYGGDEEKASKVREAFLMTIPRQT
ncbi:MAG: ABC transporter substrate-binding protein, partial [Propionicimonas sp.]